jgi:hypothetical protein
LQQNKRRSADGDGIAVHRVHHTAAPPIHSSDKHTSKQSDTLSHRAGSTSPPAPPSAGNGPCASLPCSCATNSNGTQYVVEASDPKSACYKTTDMCFGTVRAEGGPMHACVMRMRAAACGLPNAAAAL